jgi:MFS family permease
VLAERDFRLFFTGYAASVLGISMVPVALTFAVLQQGGSVSDVGYVLAAQTIPLVALLLFGGVLADRLPRKTVIITADLVRCANELLLAILLITGHAPLWMLVISAAVLGAGQSVSLPALSGMAPQVVSAERLQDANALRGVAESGSRIIGPAIAGVVVTSAGAGWVIAIDVVSHAVDAFCLSKLRPSAPLAADDGLLWKQLRVGWQEFRSRTWLWVITLHFGLFNMLAVAPFAVLGAVLASEHFGGAQAWGLMLAAQGVGAMVGGLGALGVRFPRPLVVATLCTMLFALPMIMLAARAPFAVVVGAAFVTGAGIAIFDMTWETSLQRNVPPEALSRVAAYDGLGSFALLPVGYALVGPLSITLGDETTVWASAIWVVATALAVLTVPSVRHLSHAAPPRPDRTAVR